MKAWLVTILFFPGTATLWGQHKISGFIADSDEEPFIGVEVVLKGDDLKRTTLTDETGAFYFEELPSGNYKLTVITAYGVINKDFNLNTSIVIQLKQSRAIKTNAVVVHAVRAGEESPMTTESMSEEDIGKRNLGQDMPFLLQHTTNAYATSDAGTGIGYTGLRIRGSDPTRVNMTINGVPLNDAESQGVFWVDLPDFASSVESIEIQRGAGSSTFGGGAFGASINLNTMQSPTDPYLTLSGTIGSFNTYKGSLEFATGLLGNHLTTYGRLSYINSDGFIDRASADLRSLYFSTVWLDRKSSLRLNVFSGKEVTYQAWYGVPAQYIDDPDLRTFNPAGMEKPGEPYDDEVDDYTQTHLQLIGNKEITTQLHGYITLHYTRGKGFYEQYKGVDFFDSNFRDFLAIYGLADADAVRRRWLDNHFFGAIGGLQFFDPSDAFQLQIAGAWHRYLGDHYGEVIRSLVPGELPDFPDYYENDADKKDRSVFTKLTYRVGDKFNLYTDLQYRSVEYTFRGFDADGSPADQTVNHKFFNPKVGVTYKFNENQNAYFSVAIANKEPNRDDYVESSPLTRPDPERMYDFELGYRLKSSKFSIAANGYYMYYKDQLVLTGQINDVGAYTRRNVESSDRLGLEVSAGWQMDERWLLEGNLAFSRNKIDAFTEYIDNWDYDPEGEDPPQFIVEHSDTDIAFSPTVIGGGRISWNAVKSGNTDITLALNGKYVGEQYLDNTSNSEALLDSWFVTDFQVRATRDFGGTEVSLNFLLRNLFDTEYISNGWIYRFRSAGYDPRPDYPTAILEEAAINQYHLSGFYPQAGRNFLLGLEFRF